MIDKILQIAKERVNLFPDPFRKAAIALCGEQSMQAVLLELLSANDNRGRPLSGPCLNRVLHPNEASIFCGFRLPKRRSEYLTGRICAKIAIREFSKRTRPNPIPLTLPEIEITNTANGRPAACIHSSENSAVKMDISIAHSGDYGVALATASKCGIDLQRRDAALLRVQEKYCSRNEHNLLKTVLTEYDTTTQLAILWAAKEAAKKALSYWQMPGFLDLDLQLLQHLEEYIALSFKVTNQSWCRQSPEKLTVTAGMIDDYALAICLVQEDRCDAGTTRS
ncbi:MAG: 4'-phosphopantetheinyl transferase superfamily protein [Desulforhopalus sp.]